MEASRLLERWDGLLWTYEGERERKREWVKENREREKERAPTHSALMFELDMFFLDIDSTEEHWALLQKSTGISVFFSVYTKTS